MTITSEQSVAGPFAGPSSGPFSYSPLKVFKQEELEVQLKPADAATQVLVLTTDYTVDLTAETVTLTGATPLETGGQLIIRPKLPLTQLIDLTNQGGRNAGQEEEAHDRAALIHQQLQEQLDRCYQVPAGSEPDSLPDLDVLQSRPHLVGEHTVAAGSPVASLEIFETTLSAFDSLLLELAHIRCEGTNDGTLRRLEVQGRNAAGWYAGAGYHQALRQLTTGGVASVLNFESGTNWNLGDLTWRRGVSEGSGLLELSVVEDDPNLGYAKTSWSDTSSPFMRWAWGGVVAQSMGTRFRGFRVRFGTAYAAEITGTIRLWGLPKT